MVRTRDIFSRTIGLVNLRIIESSDYQCRTMSRATVRQQQTEMSYHKIRCSDDDVDDDNDNDCSDNWMVELVLLSRPVCCKSSPDSLACS